MKYVFYVLLFTIATMIIYTWGLLKEQRKSKDLFEILYSKGEKKGLKAFKTKNCLSKKDIENELSNLKSSLFYTKDKLIIKDPTHLTKVLIGNMLKKGIIVKTVNGYSLKENN